MSLQTNSNHTFYTEMVKDIPGNGTLLLVYFASRTDDYTERLEHDTLQCREALKGKSVRIVVATMEYFLEQVIQADVVFLRGGSTQKLLEALKVYPDLKLHFEGKTIAGSSAGAYALSTLYASHYEDVVAHGLGIVPVRVVTHYESEKMPPRPGAVDALKKVATDLPLIVLREGEWEVVRI